MEIVDWNKWMAEHHVKILSPEEVKKEREMRQKRMEAARLMHESLGKQLDEYRKQVEKRV